MKIKVYSIFDVKGGVYNTPFFQKEDGLAARAFADLANDPNTTVNRHPEDFSLFRIAEFDDNSGKIRSEMPVHIANAIAVIKNSGPIDISKIPIDKISKNEIKEEVKT